MIHLETSKYCSNCPEFEPTVGKSVLRGDRGEKYVETVVTCEHAGRCKSIYSYILNEHKNDAMNGRNVTSFVVDDAPIL